MEYDYLVVGCGLAGIAFSETAIQNGKSVMVFDNASQNSSRVAAGLYNPVVLKRFSEVWQAKEQIDLLHSFYKTIEQKLSVKLDYQIPLLRKFYSIEEQNNWFAASDKPNLALFLSTNIINHKWNSIFSPLGFGEVLYSGYVDTNLLVESYKKYLIKNNCFSDIQFEYHKVNQKNDFIEYKEIKANHIVFAEGYGMLFNPFFNILPLDGAKGELIVIKSPDLNLNVIMKSGIFVLPIGNDFYKVGATYNWKDKTQMTTNEARLELITHLKELINCDFEVIDQFAGIRPTVKDRKPMLGSHPKYNRMHLLNGLGTRGVMLAPAMAKMLFDYIEFSSELNTNVHIQRFKLLYSKLS